MCQKHIARTSTLQAHDSDAVLTQVRDAIRTNKWDSPAVKPFKPLKDEITTTSQASYCEERES